MLVGCIGIGILCIGVVGCLMPVPSGVVVHMGVEYLDWVSRRLGCGVVDGRLSR